MRSELADVSAENTERKKPSPERGVEHLALQGVSLLPGKVDSERDKPVLCFC